MKRRSIWMSLIILPALFFTACGQREQAAGKQEAAGDTAEYVCPMHPQVRSDKPGTCPICSMTLEKIVPAGNTVQHPEMLASLAQPSNQTVTGNYRVVEPRQAAPSDTLTVPGYIGFDERDVNTVSARVAGRIEKLYVRYTNQRVEKGQPLMEIYSPGLLAAQRNLLQVVQDRDTILINGLKEQLLNLGMTVAEIRAVIHTGQYKESVTIYSPYNGISRPVSSATAPAVNGGNSPGATGGMGSMNESTAGNTMSTAPAPMDIREGMYVSAGQTVFVLQKSSQVWAILNILGDELPLVEKGDAIELYAEADPGHTVHGTINFIPPYRTGSEKTSRVRVYLQRPADWKIGTLIKGRLAIHPEESGWYVPVTAVHYLGRHAVVWVQDAENPDVYHVREVQAADPAGGSVRIVAGLHPGEKIVENAAYMVDSDSFIP